MEITDTPKLHSDWIDPHAMGIVAALQNKGYTTYLVGGCVRDLLLGKSPKDFDIATEATPNEVRKVIHRSYVIGRRFRLVLVKRGELQFEVATFRRNGGDDIDDEEVQGDNYWGTPEEDARRRDFTINGLFYDPIKKAVIDHLNGNIDLEKGVIKMIGDPDERLIEDPIRILRAIRLSHLIRFAIEPDLRISIQKNAWTLVASALPRRREEILKFLRICNPSLPFLDAFDLGVLKIVSPVLDEAFSCEARSEEFLRFLYQYYSADFETPLELFSGLIYAYFRVFVEPDETQPIRANQILENYKIQQLMSSELGMFKYEQSALAKALQALHLLQKREDFEKKGPKRQLNLLKMESFPLALKIARWDHLISNNDWHYWTKVYGDARETIESQILEEKKKKKRRSRSRSSHRSSRKRTDSAELQMDESTKTD
ncbi:MAG: poly(A) polymerase [Bdellovibrionales bacterium]|nr:poly(A) polymerase [Bdellovibrionales bacterium]